MTYRVRVPASTSNIGAGFDCLGLALDIWLEATLELGSGKPRYRGTVSGLDAESDLVCRILTERDALLDHRISVRSDIPIGKGLGSSAAAIVAALTLSRLAAGDPVDHEAIYRGAATEEGHPDNAGPAVYGGLVLAASHPARLDVHESLGVALAVPEKSVSTKAARDLVPSAFPREVAVAQSTRSAALVLGLAQGSRELIAFGMEDRLAVPHRRRLIAGFDAAVAAGLAAGAYGVTISGAGSAVLGIASRERTGRVADSMAAALDAADNPSVSLTPAIVQDGLEVPDTDA